MQVVHHYIQLKFVNLSSEKNSIRYISHDICKNLGSQIVNYKLCNLDEQSHFKIPFFSMNVSIPTKKNYFVLKWFR